MLFTDLIGVISLPRAPHGGESAPRDARQCLAKVALLLYLHCEQITKRRLIDSVSGPTDAVHCRSEQLLP
jgi:hypothetical protein